MQNSSTTDDMVIGGSEVKTKRNLQSPTSFCHMEELIQKLEDSIHKERLQDFLNTKIHQSEEEFHGLESRGSSNLQSSSSSTRLSEDHVNKRRTKFTVNKNTDTLPLKSVTVRDTHTSKLRKNRSLERNKKLDSTMKESGGDSIKKGTPQWIPNFKRYDKKVSNLDWPKYRKPKQFRHSETSLYNTKAGNRSLDDFVRHNYDDDNMDMHFNVHNCSYGRFIEITFCAEKIKKIPEVKKSSKETSKYKLLIDADEIFDAKFQEEMPQSSKNGSTCHFQSPKKSLFEPKDLHSPDFTMNCSENVEITYTNDLKNNRRSETDINTISLESSMKKNSSTRCNDETYQSDNEDAELHLNTNTNNDRSRIHLISPKEDQCNIGIVDCGSGDMKQLNSLKIKRSFIPKAQYRNKLIEHPKKILRAEDSNSLMLGTGEGWYASSRMNRCASKIPCHVNFCNIKQKCESTKGRGTFTSKASSIVTSTPTNSSQFSPVSSYAKNKGEKHDRSEDSIPPISGFVFQESVNDENHEEKADSNVQQAELEYQEIPKFYRLRKQLFLQELKEILRKNNFLKKTNRPSECYENNISENELYYDTCCNCLGKQKMKSTTDVDSKVLKKTQIRATRKECASTTNAVCFEILKDENAAGFEIHTEITPAEEMKFRNTCVPECVNQQGFQLKLPLMLRKYSLIFQILSVTLIICVIFLYANSNNYELFKHFY